MSTDIAIILVDEYDMPYSTMHIIPDPNGDVWSWLNAAHIFGSASSLQITDPEGNLTEISVGSPTNDKAQSLTEMSTAVPFDAHVNNSFERTAYAEVAKRGITKVYEGLWY